MLFHPTSEHIPFDASLFYFVGIFDIYDREETKGEEEGAGLGEEWKKAGEE